MDAHRLTDSYSNSFRAFLDHTDEKPVLLEALKERLARYRPHSLLDIGAGSGDLALPLAQVVPEYFALESKPDYVRLLKARGLRVFNEAFPTQLNSQYDTVLLSHVLPWSKEKYIPFLEAAWQAVTPKGHLLVITYDDEESEWQRFLSSCGFSPLGTFGRLTDIQRQLSARGVCEVERITTHVRTDTLDEMIEALAFVYGEGREDKYMEFKTNSSVQEILKREFFEGAHFTFPFEHILLEIKKV